MSDSKDTVYQTFNVLCIIGTTTPPESNETGIGCINVALRYVRVTTVAVGEKKNTYNVF